MQSIANIYPQLTVPKKVVVTMHQKPDADAMGSSLGLYHFLKQFNHEVTVISPTNWASFLSWMPGADKVLDFDRPHLKAKALEAIVGADWVFCLDFNTLSRTKNMEQALSDTQALRILIDHHQQPQVDMFSFGESNTEKSSTCEMIYDFIIASGHADKLNNEAAQCIYAGVMTDTGSFRFPITSAAVHRLIADLKNRGLNHSKIHEDLFDNFSENRLKFIGNVLLNRLVVFYEYNTALITIPQADLIKYDIKTGDTEGLVNYPLSIEGIKLATIIIDRGEERKLSFRSKGDFDVNEFARKYFSGGGHKNAAGGQSEKPLDEVAKDFEEAMKQNRNQLSTYNF
ncbi:MAG: DHH family phosphoesterase [Chitinophagaceae bacterium]|jgi:phosphoesterase RecJ-like protein|nr:DHH family phosphoesterase [Chitinophagaceae bacterium]HQY18412.1 DHH family phosphoesterase [Ferruginibacter sp.]MBK7346740.1 DHH family phosphoesterase [Chitinophagaceae bacterium]MBK8773254.1 DHH family phosphoesterase [Chitinophagaceae bacterium]MBK9958222.1 DHH family phosphoesterase [Chitinophagaceae bacterium]